MQPWLLVTESNLLFQKGYGKLDYSEKAPAVTNETIYDLASLTKVITATTLAMQLYERGQLKLEHPSQPLLSWLCGRRPGQDHDSTLADTHFRSTRPSAALQGSQGKAGFC